MLSYTRAVLTRAKPSRTKVSTGALSKGAGSRYGSALVSKAVSGHQNQKLTKMATMKYSTNPYLNISKPESGPLDSMDMIAQVPPIVVPGKTAACDGGDGPLGHPKVYISLHLSTIEDAACCEYCGLRFISTDYLHKELNAGKTYERGTHFLEPADLPDWEYNAAGLGGHH